MAPKTKNTEPVPAPLAMPRFGAKARLLIYPACVLVPGAGFALGMLYFRQEDRDARGFGMLCLGLGLLGLLVHMAGQGAFRGFQGGESLTQPYY